MKKFLLKISLFLLPVVLFAYAFDFFITTNLKKTHVFADGEIRVWEDIYNQKVDSEMLIYGSSRAFMHVNPAQIQDSLKIQAYNFGMNGHNFETQYVRHLEYLQHNPIPKMIVVCVDVFSFQKLQKLYNYDQFLPYLDKENIQKLTAKNPRFSWADYYVPLVKYYGKKKVIKKAVSKFIETPLHKPYRIRGYRPMDIEWPKNISKENKQNTLNTIEIDKTTQQLFEQFLKDCQEKNIRVVLAYTPVLIEGQQYVKAHKEIASYCEKIGTDLGIPFFNYLEHSICTSKVNFFDDIHLNKKGATLFTSIFIQDLKAKKLHIFP